MNYLLPILLVLYQGTGHREIFNQFSEISKLPWYIILTIIHYPIPSMKSKIKFFRIIDVKKISTKILLASFDGLTWYHYGHYNVLFKNIYISLAKNCFMIIYEGILNLFYYLSCTILRISIWDYLYKNSPEFLVLA